MGCTPGDGFEDSYSLCKDDIMLLTLDSIS